MKTSIRWTRNTIWKNGRPETLMSYQLTKLMNLKAAVWRRKTGSEIKVCRCRGEVNGHEALKFSFCSNILKFPWFRFSRKRMKTFQQNFSERVAWVLWLCKFLWKSFAGFFLFGRSQLYCWFHLKLSFRDQKWLWCLPQRLQRKLCETSTSQLQ